MIDLSGRTALVTGASRGIGAATAARLARAGAAVTLAARDQGALRGVVEAIRATGGRAAAVTCDVSVYESVARAVTDAQEAFGPLDILVNNAGTIEPIAFLSETDPSAWAAGVGVNLNGVYHGMRAVLPSMKARGEGTIVTVGSGAADLAVAEWSMYCSTKLAVRKLTECAHLEARESGVTVVGLSPGMVATDMMSRVRTAKAGPVSRTDPATDIPPAWAAEAVLFLCGPEGHQFGGKEFSLLEDESRRRVGLPTEGERVSQR